jgi:hypothetical protein
MLGAEMAIALNPKSDSDSRMQLRSPPMSDLFPLFSKQNVMTSSSCRATLSGHGAFGTEETPHPVSSSDIGVVTET